ncbi:hypothetical protein [Frankia sp. R82]|uniref:VMAP-C domain-containing protein n=1 Tax=Frankia sp. R82 TaxID=2950553 RepID=UPI002043BA9D|nr:hypothetical protein [Frankia sp. R82]MCM3882876.1 hypothetical protein [Frankia sp. R82]
MRVVSDEERERPMTIGQSRRDSPRSVRRVTLCTRFGELRDEGRLPASLVRAPGGAVTQRESSSVRRDLLRAQLLRGFVDVLDHRAAPLDLAQRALLVECFERRAGVRLYLPQLDVPRDWCFQFVTGCVDDLDDGVQTLVDAVEDLRPNSVLVRNLRHLQDEWDALEVADQAGELWEVLRTELGAIPAEAATRAFRQACRPGQPPEHCVDAWQLFVWAAGREPPPDALAPHAMFLLRCADLLTPTTAVRVEAWLRALAYQRDLTPQLNRSRLEAAVFSTWSGARRTCVVCLQFQPLGSARTHRAAWWLGWAGESVPYRGPARPALPEEFEQIAAQVIDEAEEVLAGELPTGALATLTVEIVLPVEQLALPVTGWGRTVGGTRRLLLQDHALVVRSFDRAHWPAAARFRWLQRWAALTQAGGAAPVAVDAAQVGVYGLDTDQRISAVAISGLPTPGSPAHRQLTGALAAGIGVAAWEQPDPDRPADDTALISLLVDGSPLDLPHRFRIENLARLESLGDLAALGDPAKARDAAARRTATLLWDDPGQFAGCARSDATSWEIT